MRFRIRTLKPDMWQDEKIGALSRDARVLLTGMVTLADDEGRFRARRSILLGHVFPADDDAPELVDAWVEEIRGQGIVLLYVADGTPYGAFRHWQRHQRINRPTPSNLPPPPDPKVVRENRVRKQGANTDRSGSAHVPFSDSTVSAHSLTRRRAFPSNPIPSSPVVERLCVCLAEHIRRNDPKANPAPGSERWLTDMRLLLADRDGDEVEVQRIIDWCQADSFWRSNVLSPGKLRRQFTQLVLRAGESGRVVSLRSPVLDRADGWRDAAEYQDRAG